MVFKLDYYKQNEPLNEQTEGDLLLQFHYQNLFFFHLILQRKYIGKRSKLEFFQKIILFTGINPRKLVKRSTLTNLSTS